MEETSGTETTSSTVELLLSQLVVSVEDNTYAVQDLDRHLGFATGLLVVVLMLLAWKAVWMVRR